MTVTSDQLALAQFLVSQASMRNDPFGKPLDPFAFGSLWLKAAIDETQPTSYSSYDGIFSALRSIAQNGNPNNATRVYMLCYDCDTVLRALVPAVNMVLGRNQYVGEGHFLIALTAWPLYPNGVTDPSIDPETLIWYANQHSVTHIVNLDTGKPMAVDGFSGCYFVKKDQSIASYWDMEGSPALDLTTAFMPVTWDMLTNPGTVGGATGMRYSTAWPDTLLNLMRQGFYDCGTAENRPEGRQFFINKARSHLNRTVSPYLSGSQPMLAPDMLRTILKATKVTLV